jgi:serine protease Do
MKTKSFPFITAGLAAALITPSFALEPPADDAPPPPAVEAEAVALPEIKLPAPNAKADSAFLGVVSGEVPEMLADHLDLKTGEGVVVRSLVENGPAAAAGIAVNDVITRVAGLPVGSPMEMSDRITSHKPGEKITVDLIHKGKLTTADVTLGVRPAELAAMDPNPLDHLDLEALPKELADRVREAIQGNVGQLELGDDVAQVPRKMEDALKELQDRLQGLKGQGFVMPDIDAALPAPLAGGKVEFHGEANVRMNDGQGSVEVKSKEGSKKVTIRDQQGNVTWSGPWDTEQDKAAAPDDVRQRVDSLNIDSTFKGGGLRLRMRQVPPVEDAQD